MPQSRGDGVVATVARRWTRQGDRVVATVARRWTRRQTVDASPDGGRVAGDKPPLGSGGYERISETTPVASAGCDQGLIPNAKG